MKNLWFGGQCSNRFGLMITGSGTYDAPERDIETVSVPGRNGDLILDNGRYKNIAVFYPIAIGGDFPERAAKVRAWLLSKPGYQRLEDDYSPDTFRMARFKGQLNFDVKLLNRAAEATLTFDCKPQRFLKSGELPIILTQENMKYAGLGVYTSYLCNPTSFPAKPLLIVHGSDGIVVHVYVAGIVFKFTSTTNPMYIDCETQNAYRLLEDGTMENANSEISIANFPVLAPGETRVSISARVDKLEIIPRWWTL